MKFPAFVGPSYTAKSNVVADEECINLFPETIETAGAQAQRSYFGTPGLGIFTSFTEGPVRGQYWTGDRLFVVSGSFLVEVYADGTQDTRADVGNDQEAVSIAATSIQLLIVSAKNAYCFQLEDNSIINVTDQLVGTPMYVVQSDSYFIVCFIESNKFQVSDVFDGSVWPGIQVNEISVFPENIVGMVVSHRELWIFGSQHIQPYQNSGSDQVFDVIQGSLIDSGLAATFGRNLVDNTIFWISEDQRGARQAWRASGYTPQRISTHAVEVALQTYAPIDKLVSYSYQDGGHLFWVLYVPGTDCSWVYDVAENLWHKRAEWHQDTATWTPHRSWNHTYAYGRHYVGDWQSSNLYEMSQNFLDDSGLVIRRLRRSPTVVDEMKWIYHSELTVDFATGLGPQPPLVDGSGNPRPPQAMLRWSNDRGSTWSNESVVNCGMAGKFETRAIWYRLGRSRYRIYELSMTDSIPWTIVSAYIEAASG
jgi:hypothetical protein